MKTEFSLNYGEEKLVFSAEKNAIHLYDLKVCIYDPHTGTCHTHVETCPFLNWCQHM